MFAMESDAGTIAGSKNDSSVVLRPNTATPIKAKKVSFPARGIVIVCSWGHARRVLIYGAFVVASGLISIGNPKVSLSLRIPGNW